MAFINGDIFLLVFRTVDGLKKNYKRVHSCSEQVSRSFKIKRNNKQTASTRGSTCGKIDLVQTTVCQYTTAVYMPVRKVPRQRPAENVIVRKPQHAKRNQIV